MAPTAISDRQEAIAQHKVSAIEHIQNDMFFSAKYELDQCIEFYYEGGV